MNATRITPSNPNHLAKGSKKFVQYDKSELSAICTLASIQIMAPAGAATVIALPNTNSVLSSKERINIFPTSGFRYGGSSNTNDEACQDFA